MFRNILIIGCGPHFRAMYAKSLVELAKKNKICIKALIDLERAKNNIEQFINSNDLEQAHRIYLNQEESESQEKTHNILSTEIPKDIDAAIICTEARSHKFYVTYALENNMHVFVDKPLTVYENSNSDVFKDFCKIKQLAKQRGRQVYISCERRSHYGYLHIKDYISNFINETHTPITAIDIHFAGGNWVMSEEAYKKENHPFKYGYGALYHSGYHYVDLLVSLAKLNEPLFENLTSQFNVKTISRSPFDLTKIFSQRVFQTLTDYKESQNEDYIKTSSNYGEIDLVCIGQFLNKNTPVINFTLNINETSACKRISALEPKDPYKGSGRIRQEKVIIHLGPLMSIHISSLPKNKVSNDFSHDDFNIEIISNPKIRNKAYEMIDRVCLSKIYQDLPLEISMNKLSRSNQLHKFLAGQYTLADYESHAASIRLMQEISRQAYG